ncbi:hypothetical protein Agub_g692, partial [Astrephomene gubernaculifera]
GRCGGPPGDLIVRLEVYPDPNLRRCGLDLESDLPLDVFTAAAGGRMRVETVRGAGWLEVPPGTQPGDVLRLPGAGVVRAAPDGSGLLRGDHCFSALVTLPRPDQLCGEGRRLMRRLGELYGNYNCCTEDCEYEEKGGGEDEGGGGGGKDASAGVGAGVGDGEGEEGGDAGIGEGGLKGSGAGSERGGMDKEKT